jgi:GR25 family glycosyltransferase involved in LPS biosynthesis
MPKLNMHNQTTFLLVGIITLLIVGFFLFMRVRNAYNNIKIADAHVINMDKSKDRLAEIQDAAQKAGLSIIRWPAADGTILKEEDMIKHNVSKKIVRQLREKNQFGVIGCFISHKTLLKHLEGLSAKANDAHLILEDDVEIPINFWEQWNEFSASVPNDWDVIQIGVTFPKLKSLNGGRVHIHSESEGNVGSFAYLVNHLSLPKINEHLKQMNDPIDIMIRNKQNEWKIYFAWPEICHHNYDGKSTIVI